MAGLRVVRAEGDAAARGWTIGVELGDLIHRSLGFYRRLLEQRRLDRRKLARQLAPYRDASERKLPGLTAQLDAMADAADVDPAELFAVNAWEELEPAHHPVPSRCTSFAFAADGATVLAHNEQWLAGDSGNACVVVDLPREGVPVASPTIACCLPAVGLNAHGAAQGIDSLTARDERVGIPRVLTSRHSLEAADPADAVRRASLPGRAGGYAHVLAFPGGETLVVETTARESARIGGPALHTNHYLDPALAELGDEPSEGSVARLDRLRQLVEERRPATADDAMDILRDHASSPQAICKHADAGDDEASLVLFSMVCELESGRMWVAPGNPCETPYEEVDLTGVV